VYRGIRQLELWNIDAVYNQIWKKAEQHFSTQIKVFDVAMISKNSDEVKALTHKKQLRTVAHTTNTTTRKKTKSPGC
jgi:hypothetical protein